MDFTCSKCQKRQHRQANESGQYDLACKYCGAPLIAVEQFQKNSGEEAFFDHTNPSFKKDTKAFRPVGFARPKPVASVVPTLPKDGGHPVFSAGTQASDDRSVTQKISPARPSIATAKVTQLSDDDDEDIGAAMLARRKRHMGVAVVAIAVVVVALAILWWGNKRPAVAEPSVSGVVAEEAQGSTAAQDSGEETVSPAPREQSPFETALAEASDYESRGLWIKALEAAERANSLQPDDPEALLLLGRLFLGGLHAPQMAEYEYKRLLYVHKRPDAHGKLAEAYQRMNNPQRALEEYKIYLSLLPANTLEWNQTLKKIEDLSKRK